MASNPQSQTSLGFFGILRQSFKTTSRNGKLLVPTLLLVFISFSQLDFAQMYVLEPVIRDFVLQLARHPNMIQDLTYSIDHTTYVGAVDDVREILLVKLLIMAVSSIITLVFLVATVSSSYEAYTAKPLGVKDIFLKIRKSWKSPIVTSFYMTLLSLGMVLFYVIVIGITSILTINSWQLFFLGTIGLSIPVCYFYMATLWIVSSVVSVLEGVGGIQAIGRAGELMKGKRLQASLIMVLFAFGYGFTVVMAKSFISYTWSYSASLAIMIPFKNGFYCLLNLFMFVVYTVFYHERKTSHEEKEGKGVYLPIADGEA